MSAKQPTQKELDRIAKVAHKCFGWALTENETIEMWHLCNPSSRPVLTFARIPRVVVIAIAAFHKDSWPLVRGA